MKILLIGGTGTISSAITRQLAESGHELWLLNRGNRKAEVPASVKQVICDINDETTVLQKIGDTQFDAVCEFIGFVTSQVERDIRLFRNRTNQYITSVLPLPTINRLPVTSSQKERHWPTPIGSIRVTRLPVKSYCCENIERRAFL